MKIHDLARSGDTVGLIECLASSVPVDYPDPEDEGLTPLMGAIISDQAGVDTLACLLAHGASLERTGGWEDRTPLEWAAWFGDVAKLEFLLDNGADAAAPARFNYDLLARSVHSKPNRHNPNLPQLLQILIQHGARPVNGTGDGVSAVETASALGRFDALRVLLDAGASADHLHWSPLHFAVALGSAEDVHRLVQEGASLTLRDDCQRTPWLLSLEVGDIEKSQILLNAGIDRHEVGSLGQHAVHSPLENDRTAILSWLIENGFDIEAQNSLGQTALIKAVQSNALGCAEVLLKAGANLNPPPHEEWLKTIDYEIPNAETDSVLKSLGDALDRGANQREPIILLAKSAAMVNLLVAAGAELPGTMQKGQERS